MLSPTRELASQIAQSFRDLSDGLGLKIAVVFGGVPHGAQIRALVQAVSTCWWRPPAGSLDHLDARVANLGAVEFLVLDEVDQMLDLGFIKPIRRIVRECRRSGRTCSSPRRCRPTFARSPANCCAIPSRSR